MFVSYSKQLNVVSPIDTNIHEMKDLPLYDSALKHAPFGYACFKIITDDTGKAIQATCIETNPAFEKLTGVSTEEINNRRLIEVAPDLIKDGYDCLSVYGELATNGGSKEFEIFSEHLEKWFKIQLYSPQKSFLIATFVDITGEKQRRADFKGVSGRLNAVMKAMPDMLFVFNKDGEYQDVYAPDEDILVWPKEEMFSKTVFDLLPAPEAEKHIKDISRMPG